LSQERNKKSTSHNAPTDLKWERQSGDLKKRREGAEVSQA